MTNLETLKKADIERNRLIKSINNRGIPLDNTAYNFTALNVLLSTYLPSIARSLAIIADKMSEKDKEEVNDN